MYERSAKARMMCAQDDVKMRILYMFKDTFLLMQPIYQNGNCFPMCKIRFKSNKYSSASFENI